ncbi:lipopolysaccharide transport periplasmic protein LptA [Rhabdaerophilaceae bacterium]
MARLFFPVLIAVSLAASQAIAQGAPAPAVSAPKARPAQGGTPLLGFGSNSKEPIKVDANRLEVFDKENKAIYYGDVVVVQGQTIVRCSEMIISYVQAREQGAARTAGPSGQTSIRQLDCKGPVSLLSGTQSATSDKMVYEAEKDIVTLTGRVVIADCDNVQRGERAVYDVKSGRATVDAGPRGRVQGVFTPGSDDTKAAPRPAQGANAPAAPKDCPAKPGASAPRTEAPRPTAQPLALRP